MVVNSENNVILSQTRKSASLKAQQLGWWPALFSEYGDLDLMLLFSPGS